MNERINNLFGQALDTVVPETWDTLNFDQVNKLKDEFAKLIIQQCILAVEMKTNTHHIHTTFDEQQVLHTINNSAKAIKEHFGIE